MRYVLSMFVACGLLIVIIVLLLTGHSEVSQPSINLMKLVGNDSKVRLIEQGTLTADSERRAIIITVSGDTNELEVTEGYRGRVSDVHRVRNNSDAYTAFLKGLERAGFSLGNNDPTLADPTGYCPLGQRYLYEVIGPSGDTSMRYWSDTCGDGTFQGDSGLIQTLFQKQIPGYSDFTSDVNLSA